MADMLSQEEIDALLKGTPQVVEDKKHIELNENQKDALGEIGNISMGTSATTLFTLLGQKVTITTPMISVLTMEELAKQYPTPFVVVEVKYKEGIEGGNLLVLKENDVKIITDIMMGGDGTNNSGELTELHLSAIGEAMNQMVGSSATSLSEMFHSKIDISPPRAMSMSFSKDIEGLDFVGYDDQVVKIAFKMVVGDIIDSEIMQIIPISFAKDLVDNLLNGTSTNYQEEQHNSISNQMNNIPPIIEQQANGMQQQMSNEGYMSNNNAMPGSGMPSARRTEPVNVQPVQFQSFDNGYGSNGKESISLIKDVPLEITVELGRASKTISEILEFSQGTVVELEKLVGEPLDILVNGQFMAKGEVVVIDENYGIRITDILNPAKKINKIK
ncbi:flagellar motor switch protein FliN/FliY [Marinisporobacter balticus]|uniref:Flagellar motor switch protein FliN/FliY n=2 Tax=Marinisporobacter balticus TaxID=2018667 RepID=A0A4R2L3Y1_9FIRM|nr:flagellar motor switch phosphatase FliY [Marinisporobacter balticus]TCO79937.1 flagellar motor switch protein FliN/FliY [Marinisporobacter balticus]